MSKDEQRSKGVASWPQRSRENEGAKERDYRHSLYLRYVFPPGMRVRSRAGERDEATIFVDRSTPESAPHKDLEAPAVEPASSAAKYSERGWQHYNNEEYDQAIIDLDRAIELDPDHAWAYLVRGGAYYDKGDLDRAVADIRRALKISNDPAVQQLAEEMLEMFEASP